MSNTKDIEEIVEEIDTLIYDNHGNYGLSDSEKEQIRNSITQHHEAEVERRVEAERERQRQGQVKDIRDQVRRKKEHGIAMYRNGQNEILQYISTRFEDNEMVSLIRKELKISAPTTPDKTTEEQNDCPFCDVHENCSQHQ